MKCQSLQLQCQILVLSGCLNGNQDGGLKHSDICLYECSRSFNNLIAFMQLNSISAVKTNKNTLTAITLHCQQNVFVLTIYQAIKEVKYPGLLVLTE